jgi:hypothetical protein
LFKKLNFNIFLKIEIQPKTDAQEPFLTGKDATIKTAKTRHITDSPALTFVDFKT